MNAGGLNVIIESFAQLISLEEQHTKSIVRFIKSRI